MSAVCEHVPYDAETALAVTPGGWIRPGFHAVRCPCCGLTGRMSDDDTDTEPNRCPYCDVVAVLGA